MINNRKPLLNVPMDTDKPDELISKIENSFNGSNVKTIFAVNPEKIMCAQKDPELLSALKETDFLIPDGIGIVIGIKLIYGKKISRVTGIGIMQHLLDLSDRNNYRIFLFGSRPHVIARASETIVKKYPGINLVGSSHGYILENEYEVLVKKINLLSPDILFVGLGSPKQEKWIHRHKKILKAKICMGIGGSLDVISGRISGAPPWLQRVGFEWLYRLIKEPKRYKRQIILPKYAFEILREKITHI